MHLDALAAADTGSQAPSRYACACVVYCPRLDSVFIYGSRDHRLPSSHGCGFCWACVVTGAEVAASPGGGDLFGVTFCCAACIALAAGTCGNARTGFVHVRIAVYCQPCALCTTAPLALHRCGCFWVMPHRQRDGPLYSSCCHNGQTLLESYVIRNVDP